MTTTPSRWMVDRRLAAIGIGRGPGDWRVDVLDPHHATAVVIDVVQVAAGPRHDVDGIGDPAGDLLDLAGVRDAAGLRQDRPEAVARVVDEEQRAVVLARVVDRGCRMRPRRTPGPRSTRSGPRCPGSTGPSGVRVPMWVYVYSGPVGALGIEAGAHVGADVLERLLMHGALVAGPAEVRDVGRGAARHREPVDLLPGVLADVADVEVAVTGPERHPERIAEAGGDDPLRVRVGAREVLHRVVRGGVARVRVDARDGAVEARRVALCPDVLGAEHAALGGRLAPPGNGSPHGLTGVGEPAWPPSWPQSMPLKLAPSPPVTTAARRGRRPAPRRRGWGTAGTTRRSRRRRSGSGGWRDRRRW